MNSDQRIKRLNGSSMAGYGSPEQHRTKRKNLGPVKNYLMMKSHVSVEWDGNLQKVIAKQEQIGISWRHMRPFVNFVPNSHILADVLAIPQELLSLDNLNDVLSYEVWNTQLLENERNLLVQFLPSDLDPHQLVQELLSGDNFHFGNPFMKWGASLCSGDLHPDVIVNQEKHLKSDKKAYYLQLHNYHNDMIRFLIQLKGRWESCNDPEREIVKKKWRSKNDAEKKLSSNLNEFQAYDRDGNVIVTSTSCSRGAEEKAYHVNLISSMRQGGKLQRRVPQKSFGKGKPRNLMVSSDDMLNVGARPKGNKLHTMSILSSCGDKYMSYMKISKKQHELIKSMKLSCESIQSRNLNKVLGDLDNIRVQPYGVFIKEEQTKLHEHWLKLVNNDLPVAYGNWTRRQIQIHAMRNSLIVEMKDKSRPLVEDENIVSSGIQLKDQEDDRSPRDQCRLEDDENAIARSLENQFLHNSNHSGDDELNCLSMDSEKNIVLSKSDNTLQKKTEYSRNMNTQDVSIREGAPFSSNGQVWEQAVKIPHSYYDSAMTHEYVADGSSLVNPQVDEAQQTQLIIKSDFHQDAPSKALLHRQSNDGPYNSYQRQVQTVVLQSLFKGEEAKTYHCYEQKRARLDFQASSNVMIGDGQFSGHFKQPLQTSLPMDQGQRRADEVYVPENTSNNIYSDGRRHLISSQGLLSEVIVTERAVNAPCMVAPSQSHVSTGGLVGQHWFSSGQEVRGGWNGSVGASLSSQSLGTGGNSDQSLFSVLAQCSQLRLGSPYDSVRHTDQFLALRSPGAASGSGTPKINGIPLSSHPLVSSGTPGAMVPNSMAWMSLRHPNPALHDQVGKLLRSWNP